MGIVGGFIHKFGLIGASNLPKKLGFTPDSLYYVSGSTVPKSITSQWSRGLLDGSTGGASGSRNGDDNTYVSMMPEDGVFKWFEMFVKSNTIAVSVDYFLNLQGTATEYSILTILTGTTGTFLDDSEYAFSKDDLVIFKQDRTPSTSGGVSDATVIIGMTYDN